MIPADRLVGNMLEWTVVFLPVWWMAIITTAADSTTVALGWAYIACRVLYMLLVMNGGIYTKNIKPIMFLATVPAYVILTWLARITVANLP